MKGDIKCLKSYSRIGKVLEQTLALILILVRRCQSSQRMMSTSPENGVNVSNRMSIYKFPSQMSS